MRPAASATLHNTLCAILEGEDSGASPRQEWSEDEFLSQGFAANLATLHALQFRCRLTNDAAAALCGVSVRTYRRWLATGNPNAGAVRLLSILAGYVPWDGWQGWEVHQGLFFPPGYRRNGIAPGEFLALPFYRQSISAYRERVQQLEDELRKLGNRRSQVRKLVGVRPAALRVRRRSRMCVLAVPGLVTRALGPIGVPHAT